MATEDEAYSPRRRRGPLPGTPRGPRMSRGDREQQLLDVAEEVFGEQGYGETTMEEIAHCAGITKPVIYDHFGSKERLLVAVVERAEQQLTRALLASYQALPKGSTSKDFFRAGVRTFMEFFDEHRSSFQVYQQEAAVAAAAGGDIEALRRTQAELIATQFGTIRGTSHVPDHVREAVSEIVITANERMAGWRLRHPEVSADEATQLVVAVLWDGVTRVLGITPHSD